MVDRTAVVIAGFLAQEETDLVDGALSSGDWIRAGVVMVGAVVLAVLVARMTRRLLGAAMSTGFASTTVARIAAYIVFTIGLFYALSTLGVRVGPLLGALGLGGLVLALALQKVVENFVGGLILQARRPFTIGDTIELEGRIGVVVDVDARVTILRTLDNEELRIPNGTVIASSLVNLTSSTHRRSVIGVGVAYDTDLGRAHTVIEAAVARVPRVLSDPPPLVVLSRFGASSIDFDVYVWHRSDVPSELQTRHDVIMAIHRAFSAAQIVIAFPQLVVWPGVEPDGVGDGIYAHPIEESAIEPADEVVEVPVERRLSFSALRAASRERLQRVRRRRSGGDEIVGGTSADL